MGIIKLPKDSIEIFKNNFIEIFDTGNLAEGKWNEMLSDKIASLVGSKGSVPTSSNGAGLMCLFQIYGETEGREIVLLQSNTMYGMYTMAKSSGMQIGGYLRCNLQTLMPNLDDIKCSLGEFEGREDKIIILLSHMGGILNPDIEEIVNYCKKINVRVIEDCAHSFGATYQNKHSGLYGDAGVYSFYSTKAVPAGEGGAIISNQKEIIDMATRYIKYDRFKRKMDIGNNFRLSEIQALLIYSVINQTNEIIQNKKNIANKYKSVCKELKIKYIDQDIDGHAGNYYKFVIYNLDEEIKSYLPNLKTKTSEIYDYSLNSDNYVPLHHACLPIWYNQEESITQNAINELKDCF